jgi:hypothetical protein
METLGRYVIPGEVDTRGVQSLDETRREACLGTDPHICVDVDCGRCLFCEVNADKLQEYIDGKQ